MPPPEETLWDSEPRTLIKHQIYRHYLQCWMGKICRRFPVSAVVDAFAGPGQYKDGPDGSPVVVAKTFLEHSARATFKELNLVCLEKRPDRQEHLAGRMAQLPRMPKLKVRVLEPTQAQDSFAVLSTAARSGGTAEVPVLWILDPFNLAGAPFDLVRACLQRPRDEALITWFADEIYRFCGDPAKAAALDRHFGGSHWRVALDTTGEGPRKRALLDAYRKLLEELPDIRTAAFSISVKNETARYSLVYATHSDYGLECFNPVRWKLDPMQGAAANERRGLDQGDLFADAPVVSKLRDYLETRAGQAASFPELTREASRLGFLPKHLRQALDDMAAEGLAVRQDPLKATTRWPDNSLIRFYPPPPPEAPTD
jgi:three-Cys-motif partner protein